MEILLASGVILVVSLIWATAAVKKAKIQYGNPQEIADLKAEMAEYKRIINSLDSEGLEVLEKRIQELTGQIRENNVKGVLGR